MKEKVCMKKVKKFKKSLAKNKDLREVSKEFEIAIKIDGK